MNSGAIGRIKELSTVQATLLYGAAGQATIPVYQFADGTRLIYANGYWQGASWDATDNIFAGKNDGNDLVFNAAQVDTIHFCDAVLSDIVATAVSDNAVAIAFNTGETAVIGTTGSVSATVKLASGESYVYNRESSSWQQA